MFFGGIPFFTNVCERLVAMSSEATYASVSAAMASMNIKQRSIRFASPPEVKDYEIVLALLVSFEENEIVCSADAGTCGLWCSEQWRSRKKQRTDLS